MEFGLVSAPEAIGSAKEYRGRDRLFRRKRRRKIGDVVIVVRQLHKSRDALRSFVRWFVPVPFCSRWLAFQLSSFCAGSTESAKSTEPQTLPTVHQWTRPSPDSSRMAILSRNYSWPIITLTRRLSNAFLHQTIPSAPIHELKSGDCR